MGTPENFSNRQQLSFTRHGVLFFLAVFTLGLEGDYISHDLSTN
jgi:hypothetical protein